MAPLSIREVCRPLSEVVGELLLRDALPRGEAPAASNERLVAWQTDPEIVAYLASLTTLDLKNIRLDSVWTGNS